MTFFFKSAAEISILILGFYSLSFLLLYPKKYQRRVEALKFTKVCTALSYWEPSKQVHCHLWCCCCSWPPRVSKTCAGTTLQEFGTVLLFNMLPSSSFSRYEKPQIISAVPLDSTPDRISSRVITPSSRPFSRANFNMYSAQSWIRHQRIKHFFCPLSSHSARPSETNAERKTCLSS